MRIMNKVFFFFLSLFEITLKVVNENNEQNHFFFPFVVFKQRKELESVINIISIYFLGFCQVGYI
jgi:hypothetical protein